MNSDHTRRSVRLGEGVVGTVAQRKKAMAVSNAQLDPAYIAIDEGMQSEICVPILAGDVVLGVVDAESSRLAAFSGADERPLATIASQLAIAIRRVRAEHDLREKEALLLRSQQLAKLGTWDLDLPTNTTMYSEELARIFGGFPERWRRRGPPQTRNLGHSSGTSVKPETVRHILPSNCSLLRGSK